jgi:hypothetical protein
LRWLLPLWMAACAGAPTADPVLHRLLVSTDKLAANLSTAGVVIVHVGGRAGNARLRYDEGHLPGARYLGWDAVPDGFGELGLSPDAELVLYELGDGADAARAWVELDRVGLAGRAALLDGQWKKWLAESRPVSKALPVVPPSTLLPRPDGKPRKGGFSIDADDCFRASGAFKSPAELRLLLRPDGADPLAGFVARYLGISD